jgi:hypothetical protein
MEQNVESYKRYSKFIPFIYESFFGYELYKGDSLNHFDNGGVSSIIPKNSGMLKSWKSDRLKAPTDNIVDAVVYESPFFTEWKRADAKKFSIKRKRAYQESSRSWTDIVDYVNPIYTLNKTKVASMGFLASCVSDSQESKLLVNHRMTTGKLNFGLNTEQMEHALRYCSLARNPYEAYATGGYGVSTVWRGPTRVSSDLVYLNEFLSTSVDAMYTYMVYKFDCRNPDFYNPNIRFIPVKESEGFFSRGKKRKELSFHSVSMDNHRETSIEPDLREKRPKINRITFDMITRNSQEVAKRLDGEPTSALSLLGDFSDKITNLVDYDSLLLADEDISLYISDYEDMDSDVDV